MVRVVDNRVFLLGLDQHYRDAMKFFEAKVLLGCVEKVAQRLGVKEADVPLEGYYAEPLPGLARYFRLMRALQDVTEQKGEPARGMAELDRILEITASALYGRPQFDGKLLPAGRDPFSQALVDFRMQPDRWSVADLTAQAGSNARKHDDFSLVGLAALAADPVILAALRESVVLYAEKVRMLGREPRYEYEWKVDADVAASAGRFIDLFNRMVVSENARVGPTALGAFSYFALVPIPPATPASARHFHGCAEENEILGRCVQVAKRADTGEMLHWAVRKAAAGGQLEVHDFWSQELWTTQRYRGTYQPRAPRRPGGGVEDLEIV